MSEILRDYAILFGPTVVILAVYVIFSTISGVIADARYFEKQRKDDEIDAKRIAKEICWRHGKCA